EQTLVVGCLTTGYVPAEETVRERRVTCNPAEYVAGVVNRVGHERLSVHAPHLPHVTVQRQLLVAAGLTQRTELQVQRQAYRSSPRVVGDERILAVLRVHGCSRVHERRLPAHFHRRVELPAR